MDITKDFILAMIVEILLYSFTVHTIIASYIVAT